MAEVAHVAMLAPTFRDFPTNCFVLFFHTILLWWILLSFCFLYDLSLIFFLVPSPAPPGSPHPHETCFHPRQQIFPIFSWCDFLEQFQRFFTFFPPTFFWPGFFLQFSYLLFGKKVFICLARVLVPFPSCCSCVSLLFPCLRFPFS